MQEQENTKEIFDKELEKLKPNTVLSPEYRRKKAILWAIRTTLAVGLIILLWEYKWVRWSLVFYVPLNLFSLVSIFGWNIFLKKKIERTNKTIEEAEKMIDEDN